MTSKVSSDIRELKEEKLRRAIRSDFKTMVRNFPPAKDYVWGKPTHTFCEELQIATEKYEQGISSYIMINVPPRHGKSDICSRRFPTWFFSRNPDKDIILASYGQTLADDMSRDARKCTEEVATMYGLSISKEHGRVNSWAFESEEEGEDPKGAMNAVGLNAGATGKGADILIIDDYLKNRLQAESELIRDGVWDGFKSDLMSRLAPVHIVVILATRWHEDDLGGRLIKAGDEDPNFPKFKVIRLPAQDEVTGEYLFPERFPESWYKLQKSQGDYIWNALFQNEPTSRRGNLFKVDNIKIVDAFPKGLRFKRGWDLASSEKQRIKDDPDWTVGVKSAFDKDSRTVYIKHVARIQGEAPQRDKLIEATAKHDGAGVKLAIEQVAGYKDTVTRMQNNLRGFASVESYNPQGDKVTRADPLEPIIDAGNFVLERGEWNDAFLDEFRAFPSGKHDDQVDATVISLGEQLHGVSGGAVIPSGNFGF